MLGRDIEIETFYLNRLAIPQIITAIIAKKITEPMVITKSPPINPRKLSALKITFPLLSTNT